MKKTKQIIYTENGYFRNYKMVMLVLCILLLVVFSVALSVGKYKMTFGEIWGIIASKIFGFNGDYRAMSVKVVMGLRVPRALAAVLVGASLAVSGTIFQGVFRNPLVSPDFLGVSSGSCIGAATAILLSLGAVYIQVFAFVGGILAVTFTILISRIMKNKSNITLVLSGIIVGALFSSIMTLLKYVADPDTQLAAIVYWQMGSLQYVAMNDILPLLIPIVISLVVAYRLSWSIDILSIGEKEATSLGIDVKKTTYLAIGAATLLTASSTCVAGTISWIGLVIPHLSRLLVGPENTKLIPASGLVGGIFLLIVDTLSRTIGNTELPISVLTGICGIVFYIWLIYRQKTEIV